jgi:hypothetical protein
MCIHTSEIHPKYTQCRDKRLTLIHRAINTTYNSYSHTHIHTHTHTHTYIHTFTHIHTPPYTHTHTSSRTHSLTHSLTHSHTPASTHSTTYTYTHLHQVEEGPRMQDMFLSHLSVREHFSEEVLERVITRRVHRSGESQGKRKTKPRSSTHSIHSLSSCVLLSVMSFSVCLRSLDF